MYSFLIFFLTILIILSILKLVINNNNNFIKITSKKDNFDYIVRDLPDSQEASNKLSTINDKILRLLESLDNKKEGVDLLRKRYNPRSLSETGENSKYTSYSVNNGEKISLCIRDKNDKIIKEDNTIIFVMIHELAHLMSSSIGHTEEFWNNMKYLLIQGEKINIYKPIDYTKNNQNYCGMVIKSTPYDFKK